MSTRCHVHHGLILWSLDRDVLLSTALKHTNSWLWSRNHTPSYYFQREGEYSLRPTTESTSYDEVCSASMTEGWVLYRAYCRGADGRRAVPYMTK